MIDINKKILPVQDTLDEILDTDPDKNPIIEGKFLYAYNEKLSFSDRGGQRFLKITTNSSEIPLTKDEILETDFSKLKGSLNIFKTESGHSMYYTDASGKTFEITQGSGSPVALNHNDMPWRDALDAHPISSITGLEGAIDGLNDALAGKVDVIDGTLINPMIGEGDETWIISDATENQLRFSYNDAGTAILPKVELGEEKTIAFIDSVPNVGSLNTNNDDSLDIPMTAESFTSDINLHLISKTGSYSDLLDKPDFATVATTGSYGDLLNTPTIPTTPGEVGAEPANSNIQGHISSINNPHGVTADQLNLGTDDNVTFADLTLGEGSETWTISDSSNSLSFINTGTIILPKTTTSKTIAFTDIIPSTSTENKILLSTGTAGTSKWSDWDSDGFLKTSASGVVSVDTNTYSLSNHSHDGSYYTKSQVDDSLNLKLDATLKGAYNGLAELDGTGKVPSTQLPSYVDDVLEYDSLEDFPTTGEDGKIYIAIDTNLTYRWGGSTYVLISSALALGETSSTAYRGDRGKTAYEHSQTTHAPSDAQPNQTVSPGVGMNFSATNGDVTIAMGAPSEISISTQNSVNETTHTHKLTLPQDIQTTANPTFAGVELGSGTQTWEIYDHATSQKLTFRLGDAIIKLDGSGQTAKTIAFTDNISPTINNWSLASENNIASALLVYNSLQTNYPEIIDLTGGS